MATVRRKKKINTFNIVLTGFMIFICFITIYPIWYSLIISLNNGADSMLGGIYWLPREFTLLNYKLVFQDKTIMQAFLVSFFRTAVATTLHVFFTAMVAYGVSKKNLVGRKFFIVMGTITMFFGGGLIPYYLLIRDIGLLDNFLVYVIPSMFNFFEVIIFISFYRGISPSLEESARIDGANDFIIFLKIIIPLAGPILATMALFNGVWNWNDYFMGVIYINKSELQPIQTYLFRVIAQQTSNQLMHSLPADIQKSATPQSIRLAAMIVTTLPVVFVYPFLQKHFVRGIFLGSLRE